jgi:hypothetical protein
VTEPREEDRKVIGIHADGIVSVALGLSKRWRRQRPL